MPGETTPHHCSLHLFPFEHRQSRSLPRTGLISGDNLTLALPGAFSALDATISAKKVNKTFDTSAIDSLVFSKIKSDLFPVLAVKDKFDLEGKKQQAKEYIASLMNPTAQEMEYMERFIVKEYKPELLFEDAEIVERIQNHPMALWKCK